ncbi:MAG TPA: galactokinase [Candidatus Latescibacteria bacterium]|nr:galactokinase [Candidatus Latescibacterota bacterium]
MEGAELVREAFRDAFRGEPELISRAPGRVNLIGEHTDYNQGFVLPVAIDRAVWVAIRGRGDGRARVYSANFGQWTEFDVDSPRKDPSVPWADYPKGVVSELVSSGHRLGGFDMAIWGDVPLGAGLSSSAAIEVAVAFGLVSLFGIALDRTDIALLCQRAEHRFVGVHCGIMDQFVASLGRKGRALFLDCRDLNYEYVPLSDDVSVVVCDSGVKRELASSAYNERRAQCEEAVRRLREVLPEIGALRDVPREEFEAYKYLLPETIGRRARHVVYENMRVLSSVKLLRRGDLEGFGRLMYESHRSLKEDYEVSGPELDLLVDLASSVEGTLGARLTGAGFGGCTVNLVERKAVRTFEEFVGREYEARTGIRLEVYVCEASDGARLEEGI